MKQPSSVQVLAACVAVALLALWSTVNFYGATEELAGPKADVYKIGEQAVRFQELAATLPTTGIVSYVSDVPTSQTLGAVLHDGAQFALAPLVVTEKRLNPSPEWVVGNFSKPLDVAQFGNERGLTLVRDFGNGAVLFRNQAR
jgi:hypothetical protein